MILAKTRLVTRGFRQMESVDFFETFVSTPASSCTRLLTSIACEFGVNLCHFDAEQAFVQFDLERGCFRAFTPGIQRSIR